MHVGCIHSCAKYKVVNCMAIYEFTFRMPKSAHVLSLSRNCKNNIDTCNMLTTSSSPSGLSRLLLHSLLGLSTSHLPTGCLPSKNTTDFVLSVTMFGAQGTRISQSI